MHQLTISIEAGTKTRAAFDDAVRAQLGIDNIDDRTAAGHDFELCRALRAARYMAIHAVNAIGPEWARASVSVEVHVNPRNNPALSPALTPLPDRCSVTATVAAYLPEAQRTQHWDDPTLEA